MKTTFLLLALFLFSLSAMAMPEIAQEVDISNTSSIVAYLTPFIVLAATYVIKLVKPAIPGWATMVVVMLLSTATSFLTDLYGNPDISGIAQFGLGLASVFVHQLQKQFTLNN